MVLVKRICQNHLQTTNQTSYPGRVTYLKYFYISYLRSQTHNGNLTAHQPDILHATVTSTGYSSTVLCCKKKFIDAFEGCAGGWLGFGPGNDHLFASLIPETNPKEGNNRFIEPSHPPRNP